MKSILVLVGPSAVGKTTVMTRILELDKRFSYIHSATTRPPRGDGLDDEYIYLSKEEFIERINKGKMLEYMEYGDYLYGTPASEIERIFAEGNIPILILDIEGVKSLKAVKRDFKTVAVYMYDELSTLEERLILRRNMQGNTEEAISSCNKRLNANRRDYCSLPLIYTLFDAFIKNEVVEESAKSVLNEFSEISAGREASKACETIANHLASLVK